MNLQYVASVERVAVGGIAPVRSLRLWLWFSLSSLWLLLSFLSLSRMFTRYITLLGLAMRAARSFTSPRKD